MRKTVRRFAEGGSSDKYKAKYDRKVADIESDYAKALKRGKNEGVAKAKYEQRLADAKDDLAKWTRGDRSQTKAAEKAAEKTLSEARKTKGRSIQLRDRLSAMGADKPLEVKSDLKLDAKPDYNSMSFSKAFAAARKAGDKTFSWKGGTYGTKLASETPTRTTPKAKAKAKTEAPKTKVSQMTRGTFADFGSGNAPKASQMTRGTFADLKRDTTKAKAKAKVETSKPAGTPSREAKLAEIKKAAEAPGASKLAKDRYKFAEQSGMYKKGGAVMKYKKGGSAKSDKARKDYQEQIIRNEPVTGGPDTVPLTPERRRFLEELRKRNKPVVRAKGGGVKDKAGRALVKKSADTKGRAMKFAAGGLAKSHKAADGIAKKGKTKAMMPKMAGGGKCYAKGGSVDGCAVRGKTRAPMKKGK